MIYITGDTHRHIDIQKLIDFNSQNPNLTRDDYVIICGDFGGVLDEATLNADLKPYEI